MDADQWFAIAMAILNFAFWLCGIGIVIALLGILLQLFMPGRAAAAEDLTFGQRILKWINIAFTKLFDDSIPATAKLVALGMVLFMAGLALLVIAIIPALVAVAQTALGAGTGPSESPTPMPTPSST